MGSPRTFRKSTATRVHAITSLGLLSGLFGGLLLAGPEAPLLSLVIVGSLSLLALVYVGAAFGDRYRVDAEGIRYENRWLARLGVGPRTLRFDSIANIREHKGRTLFIRDRQGRRFVIDAVADYVEIRDQVLHAHARSQESQPPPA